MLMNRKMPVKTYEFSRTAFSDAEKIIQGVVKRYEGDVDFVSLPPGEEIDEDKIRRMHNNILAYRTHTNMYYFLAEGYVVQMEVIPVPDGRVLVSGDMMCGEYFDRPSGAVSIKCNDLAAAEDIASICEEIIEKNRSISAHARKNEGEKIVFFYRKGQ